MARKLSLAKREVMLNHLGYEPRYLAHRHKLTHAEAEQIIADIGADRMKLDAAARALRQRKKEEARAS